MLQSAGPIALVCLTLLSLDVPSLRASDEHEWEIPVKTLGKEIDDSLHIIILQVVKVDPGEQVITFKKLADLKGQSPDGPVEHRLADWDEVKDRRVVLAWARPGRTAVCFRGEESASVCLGNFWYGCEVKRPRVWTVTDTWHAGPIAYVGSAEKLREHVAAILAGREVVITARAWPVPGVLECWKLNNDSPVYPDWPRGKKGPVWRVKAGPHVTRQEEVAAEGSPHFVGWGVGGPEAVPSLVAALRSADPGVRAEAAVDLGELGPTAQAAEQVLRRALGDADGFVRVYAAEALLRVGPDASAAFPVLRAALADRDEAVRAAAAISLAELGERARPAVPALLAALAKDAAPVVRGAAAFALAVIRTDTAPDAGFPAGVVAALGRSLQQDPDRSVRRWAARALLPFWAETRSLGPILRAALHADEPEDLSWAVFELLGSQGPGGALMLADALYDPKCPFPWVIAGSLGQLGPAARPALPALMGKLKDPMVGSSAAVALLAIDRKRTLPFALPILVEGDLPALADLGPEAAGAVPRLVQMLKKGNAASFLPARVLGRVGPAAQAAVPALTAALTDEIRQYREEAALALWRIARSKEGAREFIKEATSSPFTYEWQLDALQEMGADARSVIPDVRKALRRDHVLRPELARLLWHLGKGEERAEALDWLIHILRQGDPGHRPRAARILGQLGPISGKAIPALATALQERNGKLRYKEPARVFFPLGPSTVRWYTRDYNLQTRQAAAVALYQIDRSWVPAAVRTLVEILEKKTAIDSTEGILDDLGALGPEARAAVPHLLRSLHSEDYNVHRAALRALEKIDPAALRRAWGSAGLPQEPRRTPQELAAFWAELGDREAPRSCRALWELVLAGDDAVPLIGERLRPVRAAPPDRIARLIADLNDPRFAVRKEAAAELEGLADLAEPALRKALANPPSPEVRRRVHSLLEKLKRDRSPQAVEALERIGTPAAKQLLERLASGAAEARQTREAKAALQRLARQKD